MVINSRVLLILCSISMLLQAGCLPKEKTFTGDGFTFTIPKGWKTMDEIWDRPPST